jgi:hypothetical protein
MRVDICARDDYATQGALLEALGRVGAFPDEDFDLEVPLPSGFLQFRAGTEFLTVFSDAWVVTLEGPDALIQRVLAEMNAPA